MSRFSLEDDDREFDGALPTNATCVDCGMDFSRAYDDQGSCCDGCSDRRDAHTSNLELRLSQASAAPRHWLIDRLPTLSAVAASRAGKPLPKKQQTGRKAVA